MPKIKSSLTNVYELFTPQIDDPKSLLSNNTELIIRGEEDSIKVAIPDTTINEYVDPTTIINVGAATALLPGTVSGTGLTPNADLVGVVTLGGAARVAKMAASRRGYFSLAPFGFVFSAVGDNYADAQFTSAISDAYSTLTGDPLKAASFAAFESRLTRSVANALNRELDFSSGNTQSVRIAQLFCYERDLLWLQEVVNGVARVLGWYEFANKYAILDPALSATGIIQEPEFYTRINALARVVAQFKSLDPDTHTTLQFLNDFHLVHKDAIRLATIDKPAIGIHVPFSTNGAAVENVVNAAPIPYRITTTELNLVKASDGNTMHYHDIMTNDWVETMMFAVTKTKALAALDEVLAMAHGMIENYKEVLKYLNTIEGKKIATLANMADYMYFDGKNVTPVQPYYSFEERALKSGAPMIWNVEGATPQMWAKCLLDFTTGATYVTAARLQGNFATNFVEWGLDYSEKMDNLQEYFWQVWVPYSVATEAVDATSGLFAFVNPFNGLIYTPQTPYPIIIAATNVHLSHDNMTMAGLVTVGIVSSYAAASKNFPITYVRSDTGIATGAVILDLNSGTFGSPTTDTKQEKHDEMRAQELVQLNAFGLRYFYFSSKNTALEVGVYGVKQHISRYDNFLMPINNQYFSKHASNYYADMYPMINFAKSVQAQK